MSPPRVLLGHVENSAARASKVASPLRILALSSSIWSSWSGGSRIWETLTWREGSREALDGDDGGGDDMPAQVKLRLKLGPLAPEIFICLFGKGLRRETARQSGLERKLAG